MSFKDYLTGKSLSTHKVTRSFKPYKDIEDCNVIIDRVEVDTSINVDGDGFRCEDEEEVNRD
ncbi:hypothetical protein R6Q59_034483 [Mikania micrantha]